MSGRGRGQGTVARMVGYRVQVPEADHARVEALLRKAETAGIVHRGQWDGSRGYFWWNGPPGRAMRRLRHVIGGECWKP